MNYLPNCCISPQLRYKNHTGKVSILMEMEGISDFDMQQKVSSILELEYQLHSLIYNHISNKFYKKNKIFVTFD